MRDIFTHSMNLLISYSTIYNVRSFKVYINMYWFASFDSPSLSTPLCVIDMADCPPDYLGGY